MLRCTLPVRRMARGALTCVSMRLRSILVHSTLGRLVVRASGTIKGCDVRVGVREA